MKFLTVAYHTDDDIYNKCREEFMASAVKFDVSTHVHCIADIGTWMKNTHYKATYIKQMLEMYKPLPILYVDIDATFEAYPILFDTLECDVGVYVLDHHARKPDTPRNEMMTGTIFFGNTDKSRSIVDKWIEECARLTGVWDQKILQTVLESDFYRLPQEYCTIFDDAAQPQHPIIVHHQISRVVRRKFPHKYR